MSAGITKFKAFYQDEKNSTQKYHYKVHGLNDKWYITYGNPVWGNVIKKDLTEAEADTYLKLLRS